MRFLPFARVGSVLLLAMSAAPLLARADPEPMIWKSSIRMSTARFERYWATPTQKEPQYLTTCWFPRFSFTVQGPLGGGSQITVTVKKPDGSPWVTIPCDTPEIGPDDTRKIDSPDDSQKEKQAILTTGTFPFTINLKNELAGKTSVLYSGKLKVGKFHFGSPEPKFKNQFEYYVDHDWNLPIGHLYLDEKLTPSVPRLCVTMWFRGEGSTEKLAGYLFYKGKQIASTKVADQGNIYQNGYVQSAGFLPETKWERWQFEFLSVCAYNKDTTGNRYPEYFHYLDKNPGDYEVKVLRDSKLARVARFTVGEDGKIVDNGLAAKNKMGGPWMLLPIQVLPGMDGKANVSNYVSEAFYGNPVTGFPAP